jgi:methylmalonyl-CoA mutase
MSAILGGCNILSIDRIYDNSDKSKDFSGRISKNISLILEEEGYLGKVFDPTAGSYYVETMTKKISEEALRLLR